ncbi:MAG: hypothetical protein R3C51_01265 [Parvularculaceae bacterium]
MADSRSYDLAIIGADAAGHTAAALAAVLGKSAVVIHTGDETPDYLSFCEPANFLWRMLDLHEFDLDLQPVASQRTLGVLDDASGVAGVSFREIAQMTEFLHSAHPVDAELWPDFLREVSDRRHHLAPVQSAGKKPGAVVIGAAGRLAVDEYASFNALIDDYFADESLKTHLVNSIAARFALAGDEAGGVQAAYGAFGAWPLAIASARALATALEKKCESADVAFIHGPVSDCAPSRGGAASLSFANDERVRVKRVFASSRAVAAVGGFAVAGAPSPLDRRRGLRASFHLRYEDPPMVGDDAPGVRYFIGAGRDGAARARDAMLEGRLTDDAPMMFEIDGNDIYVTAAFCPARICEDDAMREWTGQDRQALGRQVAERISAFLDNADAPPSSITTVLGDAPDIAHAGRPLFPVEAIAPPPSLDPIGAAAQMIMEHYGDE